VGSPAKQGWVGQVVDCSRLRHSFVTVRWRVPSGISFESVEERIEGVVLLPPIRGGAPAEVSDAEIVALHHAVLTTLHRTDQIVAASRQLRADAERLRAMSWTYRRNLPQRRIA